MFLYRVFPLTAGGILLAGSLLAAQATSAAAGDPAGEIAAAEAAGSQLLFDYDFDEALEHFARVSERFPEHPTGPYHLATTIWTRLAQRSNAIRGPSLRNDRFFSQDGRPEPTPEEYGEVIRTDADDVLRDWANELRQAPWPEGSHPARREAE